MCIESSSVSKMKFILEKCVNACFVSLKLDLDIL